MSRAWDQASQWGQRDRRAQRSQRVRQFLRDWGTAILLLMVGLMMLGVWAEIRRVGRAEENVLAAKRRIENDRESIAVTRRKVDAIEQRLLSNNVPDRLERIETSIGRSVDQNREAIRSLDERQKKVTDALEQVLGIPKEEIDGTGGDDGQAGGSAPAGKP